MALLTRLAALEEHDFDTDSVSEATNIAEATQVERDLIDAQLNEEELNGAEADLDVAEDAMDSMEDLISSLEEAVERGGMTPAEARQYNNHRKLIYKNMGAHSSLQHSVATEAFEGQSSRLTMTKLALEEEKGTFTKWWEAIVRFIKSAVAKTVDFIVGLFDTCKALENRGVQLMKQAKNSDTKVEGKLTKSQQKKFGAVFRGGDDSVKTYSDLTNDIINKYDIIGKTVKPLTTAVALYNRGIDNVLSVAAKMPKLAEATSDKTGIEIPQELVKGSVDIEKVLDGLSGKVLEPVSEENKKKVKDGSKSDDTAKRSRVIIFANLSGYYLILNKEDLLVQDDKGVGNKGELNGAMKIWMSYERIVEVKEEDSKLFTYEDMTKDAIVSGLNNFLKVIVFWKNLNKDIKEFNHVFNKAVSGMDTKARGVGESIVSFLKKILGSIKSLFINASGLSKWYKHCIGVFKDILNVVSIRLSNAPGDDEDKKKDDEKEEKKEEPKKDDGGSSIILPN